MFFAKGWLFEHVKYSRHVRPSQQEIICSHVQTILCSQGNSDTTIAWYHFSCWEVDARFSLWGQFHIIGMWSPLVSDPVPVKSLFPFHTLVVKSKTRTKSKFHVSLINLCSICECTACICKQAWVATLKYTVQIHIAKGNIKLLISAIIQNIHVDMSSTRPFSFNVKSHNQWSLDFPWQWSS